MDSVRVTFHAQSKAKERLGLSKGSLERMANKAYFEGVGREETSGELLTFINYKSKMQKDKHSDEVIMKVYGEVLYIFIRNENSEVWLLTTYQVPNWCRKQASELTKIKKDRLKMAKIVDFEEYQNKKGDCYGEEE